ncbi:MAG: primary-amine oxidase [Pseudomonadota bacterium]|nr:primary-amine oxidase [Pseudomonadota bacterium]
MMAPPNLRSDLDPLTAKEVAAAAAIVRASHDLGPGMRFETIVLDEWATDGRHAFVSCYDIHGGDLYEATVSLTHRCVVAWVKRPGAKPRIAADEFLLAERWVKEDARFVAALARRSITDLSLVCIDPWSSGVFDEGINHHRLIQCFVWVRSQPFDNQFAHPVEGLTALVDVNAGTVIAVEDRVTVELPQSDSNYAARFTPRFRDDLRPIEIVQPEGPSFSLDGYAVTWCGWRFRIGFTPREGLVLHDLTIRDGDSWRPVLRRAALAEMIVPYGSPHGPHPRKNAFDCGEYGIGALANSLTLGCDCLGVIRYFDAVVNRIDGSAETIRNAICVHEEDCGILWKHSDFRTGEVEVRRARRLVISFIATVGNYEYGFYWHLHLDGTIALEVKLTGIISTAGVVPGEGTRHGTEVAPGVLGHIHQHLFCVRLDMNVDGPDNTAVETDTVLDPPGPGNPWSNAFHAEDTPLLTERAARRNVDESRLRTWKIVNRGHTGPTGLHPGYRLVPHSAVRALAPAGSQMARRGGFTRHHLWVTPTCADERWPAGDYVNQSVDGQGLPAWTEADRSVADTTITVWHSFGHHHIPRPEDFPVQPIVTCGFLLQPVAFFAHNPTLDVPPSRSPASCCA